MGYAAIANTKHMNWQPFQFLYQHIQNTDAKLFQALDKICGNLQQLWQVSPAASNSFPTVCAKVSLRSLVAAIPATSLYPSNQVPPAGLYRISGYFVCSAAGAGSAVGTITWADSVKAQTYSGLFGGALTVLGSEVPFSTQIETDGKQRVMYSITCTGTLGAAYSFDIVMETICLF